MTIKMLESFIDDPSSINARSWIRNTILKPYGWVDDVELDIEVDEGKTEFACYMEMDDGTTKKVV